MEEITKDSACFFTQQLFLIGTQNPDGTPNFAPISWVSFTWGPPACLVISVYGGKRKKETVKNIARTGMLSATVVTPDLLPFAEQHNKATAQAGKTLPQKTVPGKVLPVPLIKDAKWSYECKVIHKVEIGDCTTFFAAFEQVNVREDVQKLAFFDLREINPVVYSPENYFTIGTHLGEIGDYAK